MATKTRTWIWIAVGVVVLCIVGVVAMAAAGLYFASRHINTRQVSPALATRQFEEARDRFSRQKPLIELDEHGRLLRTNPDRVAVEGGGRPRQLKILVFDPGDSRIVELSVPFWLLRLKMGGTTIDFNGRRMDIEDLKLTVEELERMGPTLIVDHASARGERVLVWSQ